MNNNESRTSIDQVSAGTARWAVWMAYAVPLCLLPSVIWRALLPVTTDMTTGWYPVTLSVIEMSAGLLTLGLVHSWGEVVPQWVPVLGGRRVPILAATVPAFLGAALIILLCGFDILNSIYHFTTPEMARSVGYIGDPNEVEAKTFADLPSYVKWLYAPTLAWGPLLLAVTVAYHRRRSSRNVHGT